MVTWGSHLKTPPNDEKKPMVSCLIPMKTLGFWGYNFGIMTSNSFQARQPGSNPAWIVMVTGFNRVLMGISKLIMWLMMFFF